jgi:hypothetical protein
MEVSDIFGEKSCRSGGERTPEQVLFLATASENYGFINYRLDPVE